MDGLTTGQLFMFALQTLTTIVVGLVGWSIKSTTETIKRDTQKNSDNIKELGKELSDLKSDLPLIYVLREDYIRCEQNQEKKMNSIEDKLDKVLHNLARGG